MTDLIADLRARAEASGGDKLLEEAAAALATQHQEPTTPP